MNWDAIGALGELVGAGAVVLTLFYLARQVREASEEARQNQVELRRTRYDALNRELTRTSHEWATNSDLSAIVMQGFNGAERLSPTDTFRLYASLHRFFRGLEALFVYSAEGGIHDWGTEGWRVALADFMTWPGVQTYWNDRQHWFSEGFRSEVEQVRSDATAVMGRAYHAGGVGDSGASGGTG